MELARAAGFVIRPVEAVGVRAVEIDGVRILEVGPGATDDELRRHAAEYIEIPTVSILHIGAIYEPVMWRL